MNDEHRLYGSGDLTPATIRAMTFTTRPDGYSRNEVNEFLEQVASAMEVLSSSTVSEAMRKELQRHADISARVVLAAQDSAERLRAQAVEDAKAIIEDTKGLAEELRDRGKNETRRAQQHVEELRQAFVDELRDMYDRIGSALYRFEAARKTLEEESVVDPAVQPQPPVSQHAELPTEPPPTTGHEEAEPVVDLRGLQGFDESVEAPPPPEAPIEESIWAQPPPAETVEWKSPAEVEAAAAQWQPVADDVADVVAEPQPEPIFESPVEQAPVEASVVFHEPAAIADPPIEISPVEHAEAVAQAPDDDNQPLGMPTTEGLTAGGWLADAPVDGTTVRTGPYVTMSDDEGVVPDVSADDARAEALITDSPLPPPPSLSPPPPQEPPAGDYYSAAPAAGTNNLDEPQAGPTDLDLETARRVVLESLGAGEPRQAIEEWLHTTLGIADASAFVDAALAAPQ